MKRGSVLISAVLFVILAISLIGCIPPPKPLPDAIPEPILVSDPLPPEPISPEDQVVDNYTLRYCEADEECFVVDTIPCTTCNCKDAINKKHLLYWDEEVQKHANDACGFECASCSDANVSHAICFENRCEKLATGAVDPRVQQEFDRAAALPREVPSQDKFTMLKTSQFSQATFRMDNLTEIEYVTEAEDCKQTTFDDYMEIECDERFFTLELLDYEAFVGCQPCPRDTLACFCDCDTSFKRGLIWKLTEAGIMRFDYLVSAESGYLICAIGDT